MKLCKTDSYMCTVNNVDSEAKVKDSALNIPLVCVLIHTNVEMNN